MAYGIEQPDGSIAVFNDDGSYLGTESAAQNQGLESGGLADRGAYELGYDPQQQISPESVPGSGLSSTGTPLSPYVNWPGSPGVPAGTYPTSMTPVTTGNNQTYQTVNGPKTVQQMVTELRAAGWSGGEDPVVAYARTTGGQVSSPTGIVGQQPGSVTTAPIDLLRVQNELAYQLYLQDKLNRLEIPEFQAMDARARSEISANAAIQQMTAMGYYVDPVQFRNYLFGDGQQPGIDTTMPTLARQAFESEATGYYQGAPTFAREQYNTQLLANPRTLVEGLLATGLTPQQAAQGLQSTPLYQQLTTPWFPQQPEAPPAGTVVTGFPTGPSGFSFINGRQLPVRQTLSDIRTNNPRVPLYESLAAFSGQNPNMFFGDFTEALPRGSTLEPGSIR